MSATSLFLEPAVAAQEAATVLQLAREGGGTDSPPTDNRRRSTSVVPSSTAMVTVAAFDADRGEFLTLNMQCALAHSLH